MAQPAPTNRRAHLALAGTLAAGAGAALLLRLVPPQTSRFYPLCPIHQYTGLLCPGCGATRALAALTHGHLTQALLLNPLAIFALLAATLYMDLAYRALLRRRPLPTLPHTATFAALAVCAAFTLWRNL